MPDPGIERVVRRLIERGSAYDVEALEAIYDHDLHLLFVEPDGTVRRVDRAQNLAEFAARREAGNPPLSTEAELLHIEQQADAAVVLVRRRMHREAVLFELRLRRRDQEWRVCGETVSAWPANVADAATRVAPPS